MVTKKIEFRKVREFGENISDTFTFIKQEFKPLLKSYLLIAGVLILTTTLLLGVFMGSIYGGLFESIINDSDAEPVPQFSGISVGSIVAVLILAPLTMAAINTVVTCYIKLYMEKERNSPSFEEVWQATTKHIWRVLLFSLLYGFVVFIGVLLCFIPGIYLAVVLFPYAQVIIFEEEKSVGGVWNRCFALIRENFWVTVLLYILISLLTSIVSGVIGILVGGSITLLSYFTTKDISTSAGILYGTNYFFSCLFYIIIMVSIVMHYFNLFEKKDSLGMLQRIQNIGANTDSHSQIEERY